MHAQLMQGNVRIAGALDWGRIYKRFEALCHFRVPWYRLVFAKCGHFQEEKQMKYGGMYVKQATTLAIALSCIALSSIGGADNVLQKKQNNIADQELFFAPVPKAVCGPGDKPEMALQGQVTAAQRQAGFQGNSCNLQLLAQVRGEGSNWQTTEWREGKGKTKKVCGYHGTAHPTANPGLARQNVGVRVFDITNASKPTVTGYLQTTSMLDPWESLKVNERRQLLGAVNGTSGNGPAAIDIYDVSGDCTHPQLLASTLLAEGQNGGLSFPGLQSHEGSWAPDGLTYYARGGRNYYAVDTADTTKPKLIAVWQPPQAASSGHGLSVSDDGTRGYFIASCSLTLAQLADNNAPACNGLISYDLTDIQNRVGTNPQPKVVAELYWKDGATGQHTINVTINKKPYIIYVDEAGSGQRCQHPPGGVRSGPPAVPRRAHHRQQRREEPEGGLEADARDARSEKLRAGGARPLQPDRLSVRRALLQRGQLQEGHDAGMRLFQFGRSRLRYPRSGAAARNRVLQPARHARREPGLEPCRAAHDPAAGRSRLLCGAGPSRCRAGNAVDHLPGQRNPVAQVHTQCVAFCGQLHASRQAEQLTEL